MKLSILGSGGMLGHQLIQYLKNNHEVSGIMHSSYRNSGLENIIEEKNIYDNFDATYNEKLSDYIKKSKPDAVINAIGFIKQRDNIDNPSKNIEINSLLPHQLAEICLEINARLIHLSTDCVFSGKKGMYSINDVIDAEDLYGKTKYLGEVNYLNCVTLRTSIIGLELKYKKSLIEWFLAQKGKIKGFTNAIYSGFTTLEMARIIEMLLLRYPDLSGIYHVASEPIDKYTLLSMLAEKLNRQDITIEPYDDFVCDRSLNADEFNKLTNYNPPSWDSMLDELANQIKERGDTFQ